MCRLHCCRGLRGGRSSAGVQESKSVRTTASPSMTHKARQQYRPACRSGLLHQTLTHKALDPSVRKSWGLRVQATAQASARVHGYLCATNCMWHITSIHIAKGRHVLGKLVFIQVMRMLACSVRCGSRERLTSPYQTTQHHTAPHRTLKHTKPHPHHTAPHHAAPHYQKDTCP